MKTYKIVEIAEILEVTPATVKKEISRNKLKAFKVGTDWRVSEQALQDYMGVIANGYKTENEVRLEKENQSLKKELDKYRSLFIEISSSILKVSPLREA